MRPESEVREALSLLSWLNRKAEPGEEKAGLERAEIADSRRQDHGRGSNATDTGVRPGWIHGTGGCGRNPAGSGNRPAGVNGRDAGMKKAPACRG